MTDLLHPITDGEWMGFQGAETFSDGQRPIYGEVAGCLIVAGETAIDIYTGEGPDPASFLRTFPEGFPPALVRYLAQQVAMTLNLDQTPAIVAELFGFASA